MRLGIWPRSPRIQTIKFTRQMANREAARVAVRIDNSANQGLGHCSVLHIVFDKNKMDKNTFTYQSPVVQEM